MASLRALGPWRVPMETVVFLKDIFMGVPKLGRRFGSMIFFFLPLGLYSCYSIARKTPWGRRHLWFPVSSVQLNPQSDYSGLWF